MPFSETEKNELLSLKGVGPTVITRFEQIGIHSLDQLKNYDVEFITKTVDEMLGSTCWSNSPQSKTAVKCAIDYAKNS